MKKFLRATLFALPILLVITAVFFRHDVYDAWRLSQYEPSARIEALAKATTMNDEAQRLFYVTHPQIDSQADFNQHCDIKEFSIVLGCFDGRNIYLYDIKDKRLEGIVEVTAAHEMLHMAYSRLSKGEREKIDSLTNSAYKNVKSKRIKDTIKNYEKEDPSAVPNELHSILATEVKDLPDELEDYYKQYFNDRSAIVSLSADYEQEFASREDRVAKLDAQLKVMRIDIDNNQLELDAQAVDLNMARDRLDQLKASGQIQAYNASVADFNAQVNDYNNSVSSAKALIDEYNTLVKTRNDLATEVQGLIEAIDSTPETFE